MEITQTAYEKGLLSPKALKDFSPQAFMSYIRSLEIIPPKKEPKWLSFTRNKKGTPIITCRRKPKWVLKSEIEALAKEHGIPQNEMWEMFRKRKIDIRSTEQSDKMIEGELPW